MTKRWKYMTDGERAAAQLELAGAGEEPPALSAPPSVYTRIAAWLRVWNVLARGRSACDR